MSYARTVVAMSRGGLPSVGEQPLREEHVEVSSADSRDEVKASPSPPPPPSSVPVLRPMRSRDEPVLVAEPAEPLQQREVAIERVREVLAPIRTERTVVATHTIEREKLVMPELPVWLAEDRTAPDPLVESADTEELRELLRRVRQWTASEPTIISEEAVSPLEPEAAPVAAEPMQISIGNVVITVEDAPAPSTQAAPQSAAPHRTSSDRLARNHIRRP